MSCRVNIILKNTEDTHDLVVPTAAVFEGETDSTPSVWILEGKDTFTVKKQHVKLGGFADRNHILILNGLKAGQKIVVAGAKRLVEGEKVTILNQKTFH
jgi:multidrug efflux pump subunit AcrA (membrane-fusion protein)